MNHNAISAIANAIAAIAAVAAIAATYFISRQQLRAGARPVIAFTMGNNYRWRAENVGSGPALRVLIGDQGSSGEWVSITNCYPLAAGAFVELTWLQAAAKLVVVYSSVDGQTFTTVCYGNRNRFVSRNEYPEWVPTGEQWFWKVMSDAREETTLSERDIEGKSSFELE